MKVHYSSSKGCTPMAGYSLKDEPATQNEWIEYDEH